MRIDVDDDGPATSEVSTTSGYTIDLNNLPGQVKVDLIQKGELSIDGLISPPNMPGEKLQALRSKNREHMEAALRKVTDEENPYSVDDMVLYRETSYQVLKVDPLQGVQIKKVIKGIPKLVWIHHSKVKKVEVE